MTAPHPLEIPSGPDALDAGWLTAALRAGGVLSAARVAEATVEPVGDGHAFAGHPVRVRLSYDRDGPGAPASLVAKFPAEDPAMRRALSGLGWYESEIRFYEEIADGAVRTPRRYFSAMAPERLDYVLLLEDVTAGRTGDQVTGGSLAQAEAVIDHIARFHARWWEHPRLDALDWITAGAVRPAEHAAMFQEFYRRSWTVVRESMDGVLSPRVTGIAEGLRDAYAAIVVASAERPRTLIHGDCRLDNVFFFDDPDERPMFIDWQLLSMGRGVYDIAYFLGTNLDPGVRRAHEQALLRRYHEAVAGAAADRATDGYGFDRCLRDYRLAMLLTFGFWVQSAGAPTFPEAGHPMRDAALSRVSTALVDLDAGALVAEFGA